MLQILSITFPIYAAVAIGYFTVRGGLFARADMKVLGAYVLNIALPALLFSAIATRPITEVLDTGYLLAYLIGGLVMVVISWLWFSLTAKNEARRAVAIMGATCSNSAYIGYPLMLLAFPSLAGPVLAMNFLVETLVLIPISLMFLESSRAQSGIHPVIRFLSVLKSVLRQPMIFGLLAGLAVSFLGLPVPDSVHRLMSMLAASASALALVVIGGTLAGLPLRGHSGFAAQIVAAKLLVHPVVVALVTAGLIALGLGPTGDLARIVIISSAIPMFTIYAVFAQAHGEEAVASIAQLAATSAAFITLSVLLSTLT